METLRQTIKTLFQLQKSDNVIASLLKGNSHDDVHVNRQWFVRAYLDDISPIRTKDQVEAIFDLFQSKWASNDNNIKSLAFCPSNSVFNVLLHFSSCVLKEYKHQPVCRYDDLLRWHDLTSNLGEDLFTTSYLAAKDVMQEVDRRFFNWKDIISHDNAALGNIFEKRMIDLHYHLYGSIFVFDLNWLSLMNDVTDRQDSFRKIFDYLRAPHIINSSEVNNSLYNKVMKAASIRLLLFWYLNPDVDDAFVESYYRSTIDMLGIDEDLLMNSKLLELSNRVNVARMMKGYRFGTQGNTQKNILDYAISADIMLSSAGEGEYIYSVLAGERFLMYRMFKRIFEGTADSGMATLFYIYLLIKSEFRNEIVQLNDSVGFANFADYQGRKVLFLKENSAYSEIVSQVAIGSSLCDSQKYLEARISPKGSKEGLQKTLEGIDKSLRNGNLASCKTDVLDKRYSIILHFIKRNDKEKQKAVQLHRDSSLYYRHYGLRNEIKKQATALKNWLKMCSELNKDSRVVGIDAASSEIKCRPEVFGQVFRYLKYYVPTSAYNSKDKELGFTFHVGEDFLDIVDGLRAVRESILFLNLENRDRLGHALVLGTDVEKYYRKRGYYISMSKQTLLDNIVWLYFEGSCCDGFNRIAVKLKALYSKYFDDIYGKCKIMDGDHVLTPNIEDYYNAWLLRGDNPECYKNPLKEYENRLTSYWGIYALNESEAVSKARKNIKARFLYYFYHYDESVYKEGCKCDQIKLDEDYIYVIRQLQAKLLDEVEMKHISIETNPTSNYRIGDFERYDEHPILYFFNYGLEHEGIASHSITVSINTDDKGVFSTSLEREFSVMAAALEKKSLVEKDGNSPRRIYDWLDRIREMGFEMRFDR